MGNVLSSVLPHNTIDSKRLCIYFPWFHFMQDCSATLIYRVIYIVKKDWQRHSIKPTIAEPKVIYPTISKMQKNDHGRKEEKTFLEAQMTFFQISNKVVINKCRTNNPVNPFMQFV